MPVNKQGLRFELLDSPKKDEQGRNILYAKVVSNGTINQQMLEEYLQDHSSIRPADSRRVLTAFTNAMAHLLAEGFRVDCLLGSFYTKLSLDAPYTRDDKVTAHQVGFDGVGFLPDKEFQQQVNRNIQGFRYERGHRSQPMGTQAEIGRKVRKLANDNGGFFSIKAFQLAFSMSEYMARKQLDALCQGEHPMLVKRKIGHTCLFFLNPEVDC